MSGRCTTGYVYGTWYGRAAYRQSTPRVGGQTTVSVEGLRSFFSVFSCNHYVVEAGHAFPAPLQIRPLLICTTGPCASLTLLSTAQAN